MPDSLIARRLASLFAVGAVMLCGFIFFPRLMGRMGELRLRNMETELTKIDFELAHGAPWPAQSGARSTSEYLDLLVKGGYLHAGDGAFFKEWVIANIGPDDGPETLFFATKSYYSYAALGKKEATGFAFFLRNRSHFSSLSAPAPTALLLPPRTPALLPP